MPALELNDAERETLQNWARRPKSAQALAARARMILLCAEGNTNTQVAGKLDVRNQTVGKWRQRFIDRRLMDCWMNRVPAHRARSAMPR